jgi:hypothetical protein
LLSLAYFLSSVYVLSSAYLVSSASGVTSVYYCVAVRQHRWWSRGSLQVQYVFMVFCCATYSWLYCVFVLVLRLRVMTCGPQVGDRVPSAWSTDSPIDFVLDEPRAFGGNQILEMMVSAKGSTILKHLMITFWVLLRNPRNREVNNDAFRCCM